MDGTRNATSRIFTLFKKIPLLASLGLLMSVDSVYAEPTRQDLQVRAQVQGDRFYIEPQAGWPAAPVQISYDPITEQFSTHSIILRVMNTTNNVSAALAYPATLFDRTGSEKLNLDILVAGRKLTTVPQDFHVRSLVERTYLLSISSSAVLPVQGNYTGAVSLVFDEVPPEEITGR
jgi:CS1 type fimbrial major subunit